MQGEFAPEILTLRFVGEELETKGMPIYELGTALVAVQKIINKAFLAKNERLSKGKFPTRDERLRLALQIASHEKRSDFFAFAPFLTDPANAENLIGAVKWALDALAAYALGKVLDKFQEDDNEQRAIYIGSIHSEMVNIVNRIENIGGCDSIEIGSGLLEHDRKIVFTPENRDRINKMANELVLGRQRSIKGDVFKLYPNLGMVEIRRPRGGKCKVYLSPDDFARVRYGQRKSSRIQVLGRPRYRIGGEGNNFDEFEAHEVTIEE